MHTRTRRPLRGLAVLAATLAILAALSVTAFALNLFGLRDTLLPEKQPVNKLDQEGIVVPGQVDMVDMISLSGYMDSPESLALNEWQSFLNGYDVKAAANAADEAARQGEADASLEKYSAYEVYDRTMADELDQILAKYGLVLKGQVHDCFTREDLCTRAGGDFLGPVAAGSTRFYDDGSFSFDAQLPRPGTEEDFCFQFHRSVKGSFDGLLLNIRDAAAYEQWTYTTACGETVLLALGPIKGLVLANLDDCFITLNVLSGTEKAWMPEQTPIGKADLEYIADSLDLSLLHPVIPYAQTPETAETERPVITADPGLPQTFLSLLPGGDGNQSFYNTEAGEIMDLQSYSRWRAPMDEDEPVAFYAFAPVDLDRDGISELVLWERWKENLGYGCLILRVRDGQIDGYPMAFRAFLELKADGSYSASGGAGSYSVRRMRFDGNGRMEEEILASEGYFIDVHRGEYGDWVRAIDGRDATEAEFSAWLDAWTRRADAAVYDYTEADIRAVFKEKQ